MAWLGINSSHIDSLCGEDAGDTLADALDGTDFWEHNVNETHWFILDLGVSYDITRVRARSNLIDDPIDVDVYVSDSKVDWGDAVATGITTWQDTASWVEVDSTDKSGRYIKVVINDTEGASGAGELQWGQSAPPITIFDVEGSFAQTIYPDAISTEESINAPQLNLTIFPSTIATEESINAPQLNLTIFPDAITTEESINSPQLNLTIFPDAISTEELVWGPYILIGPTARTLGSVGTNRTLGAVGTNRTVGSVGTNREVE